MLLFVFSKSVEETKNCKNKQTENKLQYEYWNVKADCGKLVFKFQQLKMHLLSS